MQGTFFNSIPWLGIETSVSKLSNIAISFDRNIVCKLSKRALAISQMIQKVLRNYVFTKKKVSTLNCYFCSEPLSITVKHVCMMMVWPAYLPNVFMLKLTCSVMFKISAVFIG